MPYDTEGNEIEESNRQGPETVSLRVALITLAAGFLLAMAAVILIGRSIQ